MLIASFRTMKVPGSVAKFAIVAVSLASPLHCAANDGFGALGAGGVVVGKTDDIAMVREVLDISYTRVEVSYEFLNISDHDIEATVTFPLPTYDAFPPQSGVVAYGQPSGFLIEVDGARVLFETTIRATHKSEDVTPALKKIGFTERELADLPFDIEKHMSGAEDPIAAAIPHAKLEQLQKLGLLRDGLPDWNLYVAYYWRQRFPAHATVRVRHQYKPFTASGTLSGYPGKGTTSWLSPKDFCLDAPARATLDRLAAATENLDGHSLVPGTIVDYILTTANTWKDGIRDFTLRIHKQRPREIISLCFPGRFTKVDALTLESKLHDYRPTADLHIYFGNVRGFEISAGEPPQLERLPASPSVSERNY